MLRCAKYDLAAASLVNIEDRRINRGSVVGLAVTNRTLVVDRIYFEQL